MGRTVENEIQVSYFYDLTGSFYTEYFKEPGIYYAC